MPDIRRINGKKLGKYKINLCCTTKGRFKEEINFGIILNYRKSPVVKGLYFKGRKPDYKPWIEFWYDKSIDEKGLSKDLFKILCDLIPAGGHIMVEYLNHEETKKGLELRIPPPATPIGFFLFKNDCLFFKDWYFPEGLKEGNIKLQGEKPLNEANRKKALKKIKKELREFLKKKSKNKIILNAKKRANKILKNL